MEVSNELLAAYAEGKVSDTERKAVREYLMQNPDELESVMMMMDKDLELTPTEKSLADNHEIMSDSVSMVDVCYSAPKKESIVVSKCISRNKKLKFYNKNVFKDMLNNLLDELNL